MDLVTVLKAAVDQGCSDIHIVVAKPPMMRRHGTIMPVDASFPALAAADTMAMIRSMLHEDQRARLDANWELDLSYEVPGLSRFRVNVLVTLMGLETVMRVIGAKIPDDEVSRVGTKGPRGERLPETLPLAETSNRWLDPASFCVALGGKTAAPLGFLVARNEAAMALREKGEVEVALTAAGQLVASALQNIRHDAEERLRARLQHRQAHDPL